MKNIESLLDNTFKTFVESAPVLCLAADKDFITYYVNPFYQYIHNITLEEARGKHIKEIIGEEGFYDNLEYYNETLKGKAVERLGHFYKLNGEIHHYKAIYAPIFNNKKKVVGITGVVLDITSEVEIYSTSKKYELKSLEYTQLVDSIYDGYWSVDTDGNIIDVNESYTKMSGYSKDELLCMKISDIEYVESKEDTQRHIEKIIKNGTDSFTTIHQKKDGTFFDVQVTVTFLNLNGDSRFIAFIRDISDIKEYQKKITELAYYDELTKLPNRSLLEDRMSLAISSAQRNHKVMGCCLLDLDGFKDVNDTFGHEACDYILVEASKRMIDCVRHVDTVARLGGDEFVILLTDLHESENSVKSLTRIIHSLSQPYRYKNYYINSISASIGVSFYPNDDKNAETLLREADIAMYKSKNSGKNKYSFFEAASEYRITENEHLIKKIKKALDRNEFILYYQPKLDVQTVQIKEVEALVRWKHPIIGLVSPDEFIPLILKDNEVNLLFDKWVISQALKQVQEWQENGINLKICINISPKYFSYMDNESRLCKLIKELNISPELLKNIEFEILENDMLNHHNETNTIIKECRTYYGSTFALDDFGTGYSSLLHIKNLNVDTIKIDKSFIIEMLNNKTNMTIIESTNNLAKAFGLSVTAEGAETFEHVKKLVNIACDSIQGYSISKPLSKEDLENFLKDFTRHKIYKWLKDNNGKN